MSIQDEAIAVKIRTALAQDKRVGGQTIAIRVAEGEVFLKGLVDTEIQIELAVMVTRGIPGVRYVNIEELSVRRVQR